MTFSDVFFCIFWARKMGTSVYVLRILQFCDVAIKPLVRAWPAGLALRPRSGERASEIDTVRILRGVSLFLLSIFSLHFWALSSIDRPL